MKDIDTIRRENIELIEKEFASPSAFADALGMSLSQYLNLKVGAKDSRTGKPRGMRKETAEKFGRVGGKHSGWINIDHSAENAGDRIQSIYEQLSPARKLAAEQSLLGLLALENAERAKQSS